MSIIAAAVREAIDVPLGIHLRHQDAKAALALAAVTGCDFIRLSWEEWMREAAYLTRERDRYHVPIAFLIELPSVVPHGDSTHYEQMIADAGTQAFADGFILTQTKPGVAWNFLGPHAHLGALLSQAKKLEIYVYLEDGFVSGELPEIQTSAQGMLLATHLRIEKLEGAELDKKLTQSCAKEFFSHTQKKRGKLKKK